MLRRRIKITVYEYNESRTRRELDFPTTAQEEEFIDETISRALNNLYIVSKNRIFVLGTPHITDMNRSE